MIDAKLLEALSRLAAQRGHRDPLEILAEKRPLPWWVK